MPVLQMGGLISGIDVGAMVEGLLFKDNMKLQTLDTKVKNNELKKSAWKELESSLENTNKIIANIAKQSSIAKKPSLSSEGYFGIKLSDKASSGMSYDVEVISVAQQHTVSSDKSIDTKEPLGFSGTLTIQGQNIEVAETDTLKNVMEKINNLKDSDGKKVPVKAYIVAGRLNIEGLNGEKLDIKSNDDTLLNLGLTSADGTLNTTKEPSEAVIKVNGIEVRQNSNSFKDVIDGVEINVTKVTKEPIKLGIESDSEGLTEKVKELVTSINDTFDKMKKFTAFSVNDSDSSKNTKGPLNGDSSVARLQAELMKPLQSAFNGEIGHLFEVGISFNRYGKLELNETKFKEALEENADEVRKTLFNGVEKNVITETDSPGIFVSLREQIKTLTTGSDDFFEVKTKSIDSQIKTLKNSISKQESYIEKRRKILEAQFTAMEKAMAQINGQSGLLSQMTQKKE